MKSLGFFEPTFKDEPKEQTILRFSEKLYVWAQLADTFPRQKPFRSNSEKFNTAFNLNNDV